tara:strand:- start:3177 stop:3833 length:657 start_codon:yes stop_codon:yes gene_type:complete
MSIKNNEDSLEKSVESILFQTYEDFEFLILDDNSTDQSFNILKSFKSKDPRIKIFKNNTNLGLTRSLNLLIGKSKGQFIARQDGDDESNSSRFEIQVEYLKSRNYDFCVTRAQNMQSKVIFPKLSYYLPKKLIVNVKNPFIHGTLMIKKETLLNQGCYDERFYYAQDYKLFYDLLKNNVRFKYLKEPFYQLNTVGNISTIHKEKQSYYANCVRKRLSP